MCIYQERRSRLELLSLDQISGRPEISGRMSTSMDIPVFIVRHYKYFYTLKNAQNLQSCFYGHIWWLTGRCERTQHCMRASCVTQPAQHWGAHRQHWHFSRQADRGLSIASINDKAHELLLHAVLEDEGERCSMKKLDPSCSY